MSKHCPGLPQMILAIFTLWAGATVAAAPDEGSASTDEPVLLTVLHVNDMHGRVYFPAEPRGLAKIASLVGEVRREMPNVLLLDAGDTISGQPASILFGGEGIVRTMNVMGFDALAIGNHEFDRGHDVAARAVGLTEFPCLSANLVDERTGEVWDRVEPYVIREVDGLRVAIFGLTTPRTLLYQYPRGMGGLTVVDEIEVARELVPELREEADVVIALSHLGFPADRRLAEAVDGIDIILGGHTHTRLEKQVWVGGTLIAQTGGHSTSLNRVDLLAEPNGSGGYELAINGRGGRWWGHDGVPAPEVGGEAYRFPAGPLIDVASDTEDDPEVVAAYRPFYEKTQAHLDEVLATLDEPIPGAGAAERETPLGNLLADAVRAQGQADIGVYHTGQFKHRSLGPGPVTVRDLYGLMGAYTRQHIVTVKSLGGHVRAMVRAAIEPGSMGLHVSGLEVKADEVFVGGQPLDEEAVYTVAAAAHVAQDYLIGKRGVEVLYDDPAGANCRDAVAAYLREAGSIAPRATGRTPAAAEERAGTAE